MEKLNILLVGLGHMGGALAAGWRAAGLEAGRLHAVSPLDEATRARAAKLGIACHATVEDVPGDFSPDVVVLAVKPQIMADVVPAYARFKEKAVFLSIAAGVSTGNLGRWLGEGARMIRAMPNLPASIGKGVSGIYAAENVTAEDRARAEILLETAGHVVWLAAEEQMHTLTAISGSGPAWFFALMEALAQAGIAEGLPEQTAWELATYTAEGAGILAAQQFPGTKADTLKANVTSPGGTTAAGLNVLEKEKFVSLVQAMVVAARRRSEELAGG